MSCDTWIADLNNFFNNPPPGAHLVGRADFVMVVQHAGGEVEYVDGELQRTGDTYNTVALAKIVTVLS